ncbi:MAG: phage integrase SAM-like domain-containing protein [Bacteroidetes bacterium]|nr:phage integrase SAM-like domain-containing protein [Bacteroidota bacterium]
MTIFGQKVYMDYTTSLYFDTRRPKENGCYPIKLRIYSTSLKVKKLYSTKYEMTKKEFQSIWETQKPRKEYQEVRNELQAILTRANSVCKTLQPFSFIQFEKMYLRNAGEGANIVYQYNQTIDKLKSHKNFGTASNYDLSLKSLLAFATYIKGKQSIKLNFSEITPEWLKKYEDYMIITLKRSRTTVGIYLRPLRAIFNTAISEKEIDVELYPFGAKSIKFQRYAT